ncbi:hypothetical protein GCM10009716_19070 [Streptomyces sodiiphilus]|uniref:Coenzyme Q-binding protein COQ10 START domain-containing protein n=1 Tax=Streptomyces sodiiphilus TaxID=226217 RepID=A0ABP5AEE4_9ACTN
MAKNDQGGGSSELSESMDRLRSEFKDLLGNQAQKLVEAAGGKITDFAGKLSESAEGAGALPKAGADILKGESPGKALAGAGAKTVKDKTVGKVKQAFGGGGGDGEEGGNGGGKGGKGGKSGKSGSIKVTNIVEVLDIGMPLRTVYDYWTQYQEFSDFTKGAQSVTMNDDVESDWKLKVAFSNRSWKATVQEQIPDDRIEWTSEGAKGSTRGVVTFHELTPSLTRIVVVVEYYPSGFFEKTANLWRAVGRRLRLDMKHFQRYVTLVSDEGPEGWRGEIRDGEVVRTHEEAMEEEERQKQEEEGEGEEGEEEEGAEGDEEEEEEGPEEEEEEEEGDDEGEEEGEEEGEDGEEEEEPEEEGDEDEDDEEEEEEEEEDDGDEEDWDEDEDEDEDWDEEEDDEGEEKR